MGGTYALWVPFADHRFYTYGENISIGWCESHHSYSCSNTLHPQDRTKIAQRYKTISNSLEGRQYTPYLMVGVI